ncbi:MAG: DUF1987 domain-containing protein [Crocinitomix sp.]|nr:DUF1987 domain-containing protein [Crocinitomix sp.]
MENLHIAGTDQSPEVTFNSNGVFSFTGISTPDHANKFYTPLFEWLKTFGESNPKTVDFELFIDYLNTSSTRILVEMLILVNSFKNKGTNVTLRWKYEEDDDDIFEFGEEMEMVAGVEFDFIAVKVD